MGLQQSPTSTPRQVVRHRQIKESIYEPATEPNKQR